MTAGENQRYGGLLRFDMSKKPAWERLEELIHHRWHTDTQAVTDGQGRATFRGFYGDYEVEVDGKRYPISLKKGRNNEFEVTI
jgi:hypothetical protein